MLKFEKAGERQKHICLNRDTNSYECGCYSPTNLHTMSENVWCPSITGTYLKTVTNILRESRVHPKKYCHIRVCKAGATIWLMRITKNIQRMVFQWSATVHRTLAVLIRIQDGISSASGLVQYFKFCKPMKTSSSSNQSQQTPVFRDGSTSLVFPEIGISEGPSASDLVREAPGTDYHSVLIPGGVELSSNN
uniref:Uncharacterized protein n=1 Tax=Glossina austeni TaxID=7395 RepID=A0A1A9UIR5_GLOAU